MIPVRQSRFKKSHDRGDCLSAALASILELPLDKVVKTDDEEFLLSGQVELADVWLRRRGLKLTRVGCGRQAWRRLRGNYSIGVGASQHGPWFHAIVCKSGKMVFDPNPADDGVKRLFHHLLIEPLFPQVGVFE